VRARGAPLNRCYAFIDGTLRPICRPSFGQRWFYNGKDRIHGLKFQGIVTPDGIIVHMWGPSFGKRHDARMLDESGLAQQAQQIEVDGYLYYLYGDLAYPLSAWLQKPFPARHATDGMRFFNLAMARCRMAIEWSFNKVTQLFPTLSWTRQQKVLEMPVAVMYQVATRASTARRRETTLACSRPHWTNTLDMTEVM